MPTISMFTESRSVCITTTSTIRLIFMRCIRDTKPWSIGDMPVKQMKLIDAWVVLHHDELLANWELALNEEPLYQIDPLK